MSTVLYRMPSLTVPVKELPTSLAKQLIDSHNTFLAAYLQSLHARYMKDCMSDLE